MTISANGSRAKTSEGLERARKARARREKIAQRLERLTYSVDEVSVMLGLSETPSA